MRGVLHAKRPPRQRLSPNAKIGKVGSGTGGYPSPPYPLKSRTQRRQFAAFGAGFYGSELLTSCKPRKSG